MKQFHIGSLPMVIALALVLEVSPRPAQATSLLAPEEAPRADADAGDGNVESDMEAATNAPPPLVRFGSTLGPEALAAHAADDSPLAADHDHIAMTAEQVDILVDRIREAYEDNLPNARLDDHQEQAFLQDVRRHLEAAKLQLPSTNPDDYETREYQDGVPVNNKAPRGLGGDEGSLSLSQLDGETIYTYRDQKGRIIYQGPIDSRDDRQHLPFEVWKKYFELERDAEESTPGSRRP